MDKLDRMLYALPPEGLSPDLIFRITSEVRRRHRRRQFVRRAGALLLGVTGVWLVSPASAWFSSGQLYAPGMPWLVGSLSYLNYQWLELIDHLWNGTFSLQTVIGSSLALSIWLGALLLCSAIFLALDPRVVQPLPPPRTREGPTASRMLPT